MIFNSNPFEGLVKVIVVLTIIGVLLGTSFAGTDLLNPRTSAAKANHLDMETAHQQTMNQLEERLATAKTDTEVRAVQREMQFQDARYEYAVRMLSQDLAHKEVAFSTSMTILELAAKALVAALALGVLLWFAVKACSILRSSRNNSGTPQEQVPASEKERQVVPERSSYDPWYSPHYRLQKRKAARQTERSLREAELIARMKPIKDQSIMSSEEYKHSPLAE